MSAPKWVLPAWTGPDSPQTPVPVPDVARAPVPGPELASAQVGTIPASLPTHESDAASAPAAPSTVPLPRYTGTIIAACPACGTDLEDEAFSYWCPACQRSWSFTQVAWFDDGSPDDGI